MLIKPPEIERLKREMSNARIGKAEKLFREGNVELETFSFSWDHERVTIEGHIHDGTRTVSTKMMITIADQVIFHSACFLDYGHACEHILAMALEIKNNDALEKQILDELYQISEREQKQEFNRMLSSFESYKEDELDDIGEHKNGTIDIVPVIVHKNDEYELSFKIGEKKMYKIKSIVDFSNTFEKKTTIYFGEKLFYINEEEAYTPNAKAYLKWIVAQGDKIKYATYIADQKLYYSSLKIAGSKIILDEKTIEGFIECFKNSNHNIEIEKDKNIVEVKREEPKINFVITKNGDNYNMKLKEDVPDVIKGNLNSYIIYKDKIVEFDTKKYANLLILLSIYKRAEVEKYVFDEEGLKEFVEKIMIKVPEGIDISELPEEDKNKYIPKKLSVIMKLDIDEMGWIENNITFCYGDFEFNPFAPNSISIPRNMDQERNVLDILREDGFLQNPRLNNMVLTDEDKTYDFLNERIDEYMSKYEVLISEEFKKKQIIQPRIGTIGVKIQNDLLSIDLSNINYDPTELEDIMEKYKLKKRYYKLRDGSFLKLEQNENMEFLDKLVDGMDIDFKKVKDGKIKLPVNRSLYLNRLIEKNPEIDVVEDGEYKKLIDETTNARNDEEVKIPENLEGVLRDYQKTGYKWLKVLDRYKFGGILADDMGLGKTLQVISLFQTQEKGETSIVVCPSSLSLNWRNEINKFAPNTKVCVVRGNASEREEIIKNTKKFDVIVTSYDLLKRDIDLYEEANWKFRYIIADEAQYIKNSNTQNAKALKSLQGKERFALTGTPIENSLAELWSIFDYIMPGYLFSYSKFKKQFETEIVKYNDENKLQKLKTMIEPFILRRTKKQVLTELPDKTITVLNNEMEGEQQKIYLSYLAKAKKEIMQTIKDEGFEKSQIKILSVLTRLRQICCHPSLFIENYKGESSKLNQCVEIIEDAIESGHKILLFSGYTQMFPLIEKELNKRFIEYYKLTGETKIDERIEMVDKFNKDPDVKIFLISLKAGGTGLNLTGADMVIHYDPWWNLSAENQATDRAYRIGQKNNVQVYKLITSNSIEEKIQELQEKKAKLIDDVLDTKQTFISKLSKDEIMLLFAE